MAMAVPEKNKHYLFKDIQRLHFNYMPDKCLDQIDTEVVIMRVLEVTPISIHAMKSKLPEGFPDWIAESVVSGIRVAEGSLERIPKS